jgi:anti-anti-sigma factor
METRQSSHLNWDILHLSGNFELRLLGSARELFDRYRNKPEALVALELSQTALLDSSAIALVVKLHRILASSTKGKLVLISPRDEVLEVLEVAGLDKIIPIFKTMQDFTTTYPA